MAIRLGVQDCGREAEWIPKYIYMKDLRLLHWMIKACDSDR
jgi:hypothetical protein